MPLASTLAEVLGILCAALAQLLLSTLEVAARILPSLRYAPYWD